MGKKERNFLNKLEFSLENLSGNEVVDVGNLPLDSAIFLKNIYTGTYVVDGPREDKENSGFYAIAFSSKGGIN